MIRMKTNLNEYYFGGNSALTKAEGCLERLKNDFLNPMTATQDFTVHPANIELKKCLCEVFGFEDILLDMTVTGTPAIFTLPVRLDFDTVKDNLKGSKYLTTNKYGIAFTKKAHCVPFIKFNPSVFLTMKFTAREALAVILHEIGHNFFPRETKRSVFMGLMATTRIMNYVLSCADAGKPVDYNHIASAILVEVYPYNVAISGLNVISNFLRKNPVTKPVVTFLNLALEAFLVAKHEMEALDALLIIFQDLGGSWARTLNSYVLRNAFNILSFGWIDNVFLSYANEKFSDNFATSYGYGPDLVTALGKLEQYFIDSGYTASTVLSEIVKKDPSGSLRFALTVCSLPKMVLSHALMDCHPDTDARVIDQLKMLRSELNRQDLKPQTRKMLMDDLQKMETAHNRYFHPQTSDDAGVRFKKLISRSSMWYGGDLREIINSTKNYDWSQITKAIFNGKKDSTFKGL